MMRFCSKAVSWNCGLYCGDIFLCLLPLPPCPAMIPGRDSVSSSPVLGVSLLQTLLLFMPCLMLSIHLILGLPCALVPLTSILIPSTTSYFIHPSTPNSLLILSLFSLSRSIMPLSCLDILFSLSRSIVPLSCLDILFSLSRSIVPLSCLDILFSLSRSIMPLSCLDILFSLSRSIMPLSCLDILFSVWNILFVALRIKMIVNLNLLWNEFVETMRRFDLLPKILVAHRYLGQVTRNLCVTKICRSRSKRRIVPINSLQGKFKFTIILISVVDTSSCVPIFAHLCQSYPCPGSLATIVSFHASLFCVSFG